ncbi:MAG: porin [Sutterella sp.]|nr:porin [Sutterella sp.]
MKKTLAALAVLGAFAGTSMAADVTLYGIIDTGLTYQRTDTGVANTDTTSTFTMESGSNSATRFGLKGVEELGNGLKVGFVLENGFKSDTGAMGTQLFDREAQVYVAGAFGQLGAGRMGQLDSGNGTYALFGGAVAPFSTGWTGVPGHKYVMSATFDRFDNTLTYKSPTFAGFNVYAQYSNGANAGEGTAATDRFYAVGAAYKNGPLNASLVVSQKNLKSNDANGRWEAEDPLAVSLGGAYDFGVAKAFVATQYFKDSKLAAAAVNTSWAGELYYTGFGINLGVSAPVLGGTAKFNVGFMDADLQPTSATGVHQADGKEYGMKRVTVAAGYEYPLSKRTFVYGGAGYYQDSYDDKGDVSYDDGKKLGVTAGLVHKF